jgi:hypothetical protein
MHFAPGNTGRRSGRIRRHPRPKKLYRLRPHRMRQFPPQNCFTALPALLQKLNSTGNLPDPVLIFGLMLAQHDMNFFPRLIGLNTMSADSKQRRCADDHPNQTGNSSRQPRQKHRSKARPNHGRAPIR